MTLTLPELVARIATDPPEARTRLFVEIIKATKTADSTPVAISIDLVRQLAATLLLRPPEVAAIQDRILLLQGTLYEYPSRGN